MDDRLWGVTTAPQPLRLGPTRLGGAPRVRRAAMSLESQPQEAGQASELWQAVAGLSRKAPADMPRRHVATLPPQLADARTHALDMPRRHTRGHRVAQQPLESLRRVPGGRGVDPAQRAGGWAA